MLIRILTAVVCIAILIPVLIFSDYWIFPAAVGLLAMVAIYEIAGCVGIRRKFWLAATTYLFSAAIFALVATYFLHYITLAKFIPILFAVSYLFIFLIFVFTMLSKGNIKFSQSAELVSLTIYILVGFLSIILLRAHGDMGKYLYLLIFLGAWMTDTGAYFTGVFFGKHKLIPEVSPKKTVEGAIGGILGCVLGYTVYALILDKCFDVTVNYVALIILSVVIAVISQCGDLVASYVKRERGIKDYGFIFPGHGGVMDRFDSIIAVAPIIYGVVLLLPSGCAIFS